MLETGYNEAAMFAMMRLRCGHDAECDEVPKFIYKEVLMSALLRLKCCYDESQTPLTTQG